MKASAKRLKSAIRGYFKKLPTPLMELKSQTDPFHNPIAWLIKEDKIPHQEALLLKECQNTATLFITEENRKILYDYFTERQQLNDKIGQYYKTLSFSDFILRLWTHRFKEVYFDGRAVVGRKRENFAALGEKEGRAFLQSIGTPLDTENYYQNYLTLEEAVLSPLVLPQAVSVIVGTGSRSNQWDVENEFDDSIDIAAISYPAAAEFRDGHTTHYDAWFILKPAQPDANYDQQRRLIQNNPALCRAARAIYGPQLAFEMDLKKMSQDEVIKMKGANNQTYYLCKQAYISRTKNILKSVLLAANAHMQAHQLGDTLQLKGLGLGAFAFTDSDSNHLLENLYVETLHSLLAEPDFKLSYIKQINLINLPTDYARKVKFMAPIKGPSPISSSSNVEKNQFTKKNIALCLIGGISGLILLATGLIPLMIMGALALGGASTFMYARVTRKVILLAPATPTPPIPVVSPHTCSVTRKVVEPSARDTLNDIGAIVVCGDSGSQFGNEGNIGLRRSSSDDPASQYSLIDPEILLPKRNPRLVTPACISILDKQGHARPLSTPEVTSPFTSSKHKFK